MTTKLRAEGGNAPSVATESQATKCMKALVTHHFGNSSNEGRSTEMENGFKYKVGDIVQILRTPYESIPVGTNLPIETLWDHGIEVEGGWFFDFNDIVKVGLKEEPKPKFKIGEEVLCEERFHPYYGKIVKFAGTAAVGPDYRLVELDGFTRIVYKENIKKIVTGGLKYDSDKPPMDLISRTFLVDLAKVLGFGATKYKRNNWRQGIEQSRLIAAALRHITAYNEGEDTDPESGLSHIAHAACCLMFLSELSKTRPDLDDRYKTNV